MSGSFLVRQMGQLLVNRSRNLIAWNQMLFKSTATAGSSSSGSKPTPAPPSDEFAEDSNAEKMAEAGQVDSDFVANIPEAEEARLREEQFQQKVERMRNVSRLQKDGLVRKHNKQMPEFTDPEADFLKSAKLYRKLYAKFGRESGIDPGLAWPTASELKEQIKFETEKGMSLEKKINILVERKMTEMEAEQKV